MTDPAFVMRAGDAGAIVEGTPGNVLAIDTGGRVRPIPAPAASGMITGPGVAGSLVLCSREAGADLLLPFAHTTVWVPAMSGDCTYQLLNAGASAGDTVGFAGPFTGGQLDVHDADDNSLFSMLDPGGHWGVALFNGSAWVRYASGA